MEAPSFTSAAPAPRFRRGARRSGGDGRQGAGGRL